MQAIKEIIPNVLQNLQTPALTRRGSLTRQWPAIVGAKIASHTRPLLDEEGRLCVWVDQASLAFELNQKYRPTLLKRVQTTLGDETIQSVQIRIGQLR